MIEVATFRLAAGVEEDDFVAAHARAQTEFFNLQSGLLRRTTARGDDGTWIVITLWSDADAATAAAHAAAADPAPLALADRVDDVTLDVRRYRELD